MNKHFFWITFISKRLANVDREGRTKVSSVLSLLGICFGVMTLIVVLSVMNGFQSEFKNAILELSSYHLRVENVPSAYEYDFINFLENEKLVDAVVPFYEAESFIVSETDNQSVAFIRALPQNVCYLDAGFKNELEMISGDFLLEDEEQIVLGSRLAFNLGVSVGTTVNLLALSGSSDTSLLSRDRVFTVTGIFHSGYEDINASFAFVSTEAGEKYFGKNVKKTYGVKLKKKSADSVLSSIVRKSFPEVEVSSWKKYNRSLFNVLQVEKNMLLLMVLLIFVVVGINMYNGMRRLVFEKKNEIALLSALGGTHSGIKSIFMVRAFFIGFWGSLFGVILGLLVSINIKSVFTFASSFMYYVSYFFVCLLMPENAEAVSHNPMYLLYASIPAQIFVKEVFLVAIFGLFSPIVASFVASKDVLKMTISEVLHNE